MKKTIFTLLISVLVGCDVIPPDQYTQPYDPNQGLSERRVLLEEYTGMRCVNCPAAAQQARLLELTYKERLITVSIHAGEFASPMGIFTQDLRTDAGTSYFQHFGFAGTPMGSINRAPYRSSAGLSPSLWGAAIDAQLMTADEIGMELSIDFDNQTRAYTLRCDVERLDGTTNAELSLNLWLVEDSIITPQIIPSGVDQNYTQRHVMRGALNGTWGETLDLSDSKQCSVERTYSLPDTFSPAQCSVVAFVGERSSLRILQATTAHLAIKTQH